MKISIETVDSEQKFNVWYEIFCSLFPDKEDRFSSATILDIISRDQESQHQLLLILHDDERAGIIWQMTQVKIRTCYYYYFGVLEEFRGKGVFSSFQEINEKLLISYGVDLILAEPKNPKSFKDRILIRESKKRLKYYRDRLHFYIVSDNETKYLRHFPPDMLESIQDYYLLAFKPLSELRKKQLIVDEKLPKEIFKKLYLGLMQIELGIKDEETLKCRSKAAEQFLNTLSIMDNMDFSFVDDSYFH